MDSLRTVIDTAKQVIDTAASSASTTTDTLKAVAETISATPAVTDTIAKAVSDTVAAVASSAEGQTFFSLLGSLASSMSHTEATFKDPMLFIIFGGLAIFLLGMNYMSTGLQTVAGSKLRSLIGAVTSNRLMATAVGTGVTTIIQSSSVTTVMVVGFVNSGLMTLVQALGVIYGANIGTTITGWVIALNIGKYGLPIMAISAIFYLFSNKDKVKYTAMAIMGIGLVFFGLEMMKYGFKPVAKDPAFEQFFSLFVFSLENGWNITTYFSAMKCALIGAMVTAIVQSSSATLGITITLAITGAINFETAAALVLGENIGTTVTALLASLNANTNAKRAAYGHMMFNVLGVLWITTIFGFYMMLINWLFHAFEGPLTTMFSSEGDSSSLAVKIAMVHTGFNVVNTIIFVPFIPKIAKLLMWLAPDKKSKEKTKLKNLDSRKMFESPALGLEEAKLRVDRMGVRLTEMSSILKRIVKTNEFAESEIKEVFELEERFDNYQAEVSQFILDLIAASNLSHEDAEFALGLYRFSHEYENISDYMTTIMKRLRKLHNEEIAISNEDRADIVELHEKMDQFLAMVIKAVEQSQFDSNSKAAIESGIVRSSFKEKRKAHLARLAEKATDPHLSVAFMDVITSYRKINDHLTNVFDVITK